MGSDWHGPRAAVCSHEWPSHLVGLAGHPDPGVFTIGWRCACLANACNRCNGWPWRWYSGYWRDRDPYGWQHHRTGPGAHPERGRAVLAGGNIVARQAGKIEMVAYVVWSACLQPALAALSLALEGWDAVARVGRQPTPATWAAVLWQAWGNSLFGIRRLGLAAGALPQPPLHPWPCWCRCLAWAPRPCGWAKVCHLETGTAALVMGGLA